MGKKVLFIDRDGTLIAEPEDEQVDSLEKLEFVPRVFTALREVTERSHYELVIVSNQDGLGTDSFPVDKFWAVQNKMMQAFENEGIHFADCHFDSSFANENKDTRKPQLGMLGKYLTGEYDLENSWVIGDRLTDLELALNLGARGILLGTRLSSDVMTDKFAQRSCLYCCDWLEVIPHLLLPERNVRVTRATKETKIELELCLDGTGASSIDTGLNFFNHMLEQLALHSGCDMQLAVKGDLHVDEHHTIEDTALVLGEAYHKALISKVGMNRYGFLLPMDDSLANVAIDFCERPYLVWDATFRRDKVGDMPTDMVRHFFKSFSDAARCTLNIKAEGIDDHHKIEAIFKGLARAIRMAVKRDWSQQSIPSTKNSL